MTKRLSWGVVDQAVSSVTNAVVSLYIARTLGAVQFGAFGLAYVTFSFALNASRGLATDPLMVRFSGVSTPKWRRAVRGATGTAVLAGICTGICALATAMLLTGTTKAAFIALGLTLPGLLLQDSWRYAFFALGRGGQAVLNDSLCAVLMIPALVLLRHTGHASVFWFVFAWGAAAGVAALVGPVQARIIPRPYEAWSWILAHRDLGIRYVAEGTSSSVSGQLRSYGIGALLGLAALGYVGASTTLMGPMTILLLGMSLVAIPEAARIVRRAPHRLPLFCVLISAGLVALAVGWGALLLIAMPRGLGHWLLSSVWRPTYPLVLPQVLAVSGQCVGAGAGIGLHGLGAAKSSLRAAILSSIAYVVCSLAGAAAGGAYGAIYGTAVATWLAALILWRQFVISYRQREAVSDRTPQNEGGVTAPRGRHAGLARRAEEEVVYCEHAADHRNVYVHVHVQRLDECLVWLAMLPVMRRWE
jgi:O-antigen/teichoic acid export membrane protein